MDVQGWVTFFPNPSSGIDKNDLSIILTVQALSNGLAKPILSAKCI